MGTGRKRSNAWFTASAMFKTSFLIGSPQLANCPPISISYSIVLGLNLFYSIYPHSWCWAHAFPSPEHLLNLSSSLLFWQYLSFGMERVQEVWGGHRCPETNLKLSSFSFEMYRHFPATQIQVCPVQWLRFRFDCFPYLDYSVAGRDAVWGWIKSRSWLNDAEKLDS